MVETSSTSSALILANSRYFSGIYRLHINTVSTFYIYARTLMLPPRVFGLWAKPLRGQKVCKNVPYLSLVSIWSSRLSQSSQSSQNMTKRSGRSYGNTTETTETDPDDRDDAWIASSSIRTIRVIVTICKRLNGNHSRKTWTIEAIQMYPQNAPVIQRFNALWALCSKNAFQKGTTNTREWRRSSCTSVWYS